MLDIQYGNAVRGRQRFERPELQQRLLRTMARSGGIKMFGLRRIGKSTLRNYYVEHLQAQALPVVFVDAQGLSSVEQLLASVFKELPTQSLGDWVMRKLGTKSPIRQVMEAVLRGSASGERIVVAYWREAYGAIGGALQALAAENQPVPVLVIDEFSFLLNGMLTHGAPAEQQERVQAVDQLLAALREWRGVGMKMLLTGSIGVAALARKHGLNRDHLNDLLPFEVPELEHAEAARFIRAATHAAPAGAWTDAHIEAFLHQSGSLYPSFLVKGLLEIDANSAPPAPTEFARIFAERVRPVLHHDFYDQFNKRFAFYKEIEAERGFCAQLILPLLQAVMAAETGACAEALAWPAGFTSIDRADALNILVEDGFIRGTEDLSGARTWFPACKLVRLWWQRARLA